LDYAVVKTRRSSLKVYTTSNSSDKNYIGSLPTGSKVEVLDYRVVNNVEWVNVKNSNISGWVILKHPSVSYSFLEMEGISLMAMNSDTVYNSAVTRQTNKSTISTSIVQDNSGSKIKTSGKVVENIETGKKVNTYKVSHPSLALSTINSFNFSGSRVTKPKQINPEVSESPTKVQNSKGFPAAEFDPSTNKYKYNYETDYADNSFIQAVNDLKESINLHEESSIQLYERYAKYYNRFKVATPDDMLTRTFAHVFFTRPDCNVIYSTGSNNLTLVDQVKSIPDYVYEFKNNPSTLLQLSQSVGLDHQFMMLPSNRVTSFECRDRSIKYDTYGKTLHGNSIAYGRHIDDSLAAGELSISFNDDRDLHLFRMHQFWVEYISAVNKGELRPKDNHLINKVLDYACSAYYIVCAENGEDIIYWSKLYGVFPTNIPDSIMTFAKSQFITNPEISINYQYSFKKDWNTEIITEFNLNSSGSKNYLETYNPKILSTGNTWVGAPFIEMVPDKLGRTVYKLRFREK